MQKRKVNFQNVVAETTLITLYMRAQESRRAKEGKDCILHDDYAEQIVDSLDYDFSKLDKATKSRIGCVVRGWYFDQAVRRFTSRFDDAVVVNVGCGLDTRYQRTAHDTSATYYELDLPEVMSFRRELIPEGSADRYVDASLLQQDWMDSLQRQHPDAHFIFVFEGVLMYFFQEQVKDVLSSITSRFSGEVWFDLVGPMLTKKIKPDGLKDYDAQIRFGIADAHEIEQWGIGLSLVEQANYMSFFRSRWGFFMGQVLGRLNRLCFKFSSLAGFAIVPR